MISHILINNNGVLEPADQAKIPAMDHGFLYGDSVYETLRTYDGMPFLLDLHMTRLERSLGRLSLTLPGERKDLEKEIDRTLSGYTEVIKGEWETQPDLALRIVVTRGVGPIGLDMSLCPETRFMIYASPIPNFPDDLYTHGIACVISSVTRNHPNALDPGIKSGNFLNNILAFRDAKDAGAKEAFLKGADGFIAEGTTSNVFMVENGGLLTPKAYGILDGITRRTLIEEAHRAGIDCQETDITEERLRSADEIFISSSIREVVPVTTLDGKTIGDGTAGPVASRMLKLYRERVQAEL